MLHHFIETAEEFLKVPFVNEYVYVNIRGQFYTQGISGYSEIWKHDRYVDIHVDGVCYNVNKANLIQVAWKPVCPADKIHYLFEREVVFTDNNQWNYHPMNLIWGFAKSSIDDWYRIPGFSWYLINESNQIWSRYSNGYLTPTLTEGRHATAYVSPDYKNGVGNSIAIHRLVAFSRIPYTRDVCRLDVNHIDGNKWNYEVTNLEWVTRRRNNIHAQETGLKKDSNTIKVTDLSSNEISEYYSQATCAKAIGVDPRNLSMFLRKNNGCWIYKKRLKVEVIKVGLEKPKHHTSARLTLVKDMVSGVIYEFSSLSKAADFVGISCSALKKRHVRGTTVFGNLHLKSYNPLLGEVRPSFD